MAAGKSTVREVVARDDLWALTRLTAAAPPVVIEADAIKATAAAARAAAERARRAKEEEEGAGEEGRGGGSRRGFSTDSNGSLNGAAPSSGAATSSSAAALDDEDRAMSRFVHEYSTRAAEELLVAAVNEQRDVVFDGTMAWLPFVRATIAMVRDHGWLYRRGPGWQQGGGGGKKAEKKEKERGESDGADDDDDETSSSDDETSNDDSSVYWQRTTPAPASHLPYRVEVVGVTCDPGLAVARGVWRRLRSGRCVPVAEQLRSHRLFAAGFPAAAALADSATLFHTGSALTTLGKAAADLARMESERIDADLARARRDLAVPLKPEVTPEERARYDEQRAQDLGRLDRLARGEVLKAAADTLRDTFADAPEVLGWVRQLNPGACPTCVAWWGSEGATFTPVRPYSVRMKRHPSCACVQRPVVYQEEFDVRGFTDRPEPVANRWKRPSDRPHDTTGNGAGG